MVQVMSVCGLEITMLRLRGWTGLTNNYGMLKLRGWSGLTNNYVKTERLERAHK